VKIKTVVGILPGSPGCFLVSPSFVRQSPEEKKKIMSIKTHLGGRKILYCHDCKINEVFAREIINENENEIYGWC